MRYPTFFSFLICCFLLASCGQSQNKKVCQDSQDSFAKERDAGFRKDTAGSSPLVSTEQCSNRNVLQKEKAMEIPPFDGGEYNDTYKATKRVPKELQDADLVLIKRVLLEHRGGSPPEDYINKVVIRYRGNNLAWYTPKLDQVQFNGLNNLAPIGEELELKISFSIKSPETKSSLSLKLQLLLFSGCG